MKEKRTPRLLSLALAVCLSMGLALPASAAETTDGQDAGSSPFTFQFRNGEATITGYAVEPSDRVSHLEIPATATDESGQVYPVTAIDSKVFRNCTWINSVTIPDSVTSVGSDAFNGSGLTSVTVPATVEDWGGLVFANCDSLRSVTVEEGVTEIPSYMFGNCASLTSVQLPSTLTELGDQCFQNTGLTSVNLPSGLREIGDSAFSGTDLTGITIPDTVTEIGSYAFASTPMPSITIPDSVTKLGGNVFRDSGLTSIAIPDSVTSLGEQTFYNCDSLRSAVIGSGVTRMDQTFMGCDALTDVTLGENVNTLDETFRGCSALKTLTIPASVTEMYDPVDGCTSLETVYLEGMTAPYCDIWNTDDSVVFIIPRGATGYDAEVWRECTVIYKGDPIPENPGETEEPEAPGLSLSTTSLDFGTGTTLEDKEIQTVTVTNTGDRTLRVTLPDRVPNFLLSWNSEDWYNYRNKTLEPGESGTFFVQALSYEPGTYDTTVTITTEQGPSATLSLYYTILEPGIQVTADTDALDFGTVEEGYTQPAARTITYTNHDAYEVVIDLRSNSYGGFLVSDPSPSHIEAHGTSTLTVQPKAGLAPGTYNWEVRVEFSFGRLESVYITIPLTFTVAAAGTLTEEPAQTFTDVTPDKWYYDFVETVAEKGLFAGNGDGTFAPENNMTYAEFLAVLFQFSGDTLPANSGPNWYDNHVQWAKNSGVIPSAMLAGFDPEAAITRQDMAALFGSFLTRYDYSAAPVNSGTPSFSDEGGIAGYAKDGVELCYQLGIMGGNSDGTFAPDNNAIRAEVAVTMVQMARVMGR